VRTVLMYIIQDGGGGLCGTCSDNALKLRSTTGVGCETQPELICTIAGVDRKSGHYGRRSIGWCALQIAVNGNTPSDRLF
jgi:hypothetical protein